MTQAVRRAGLRIGLVCLAAGMVVAAAYVLTPRVDLKKEEAALMGRAANRAPLPGSEAALRQAIAETRGGAPDYDRIRAARIQILTNLTPFQHVVATLEGAAVPTNAEILATAGEQQQDLKEFGPLQSASYLGGAGRFDRYRVTFRNGSLLWFVALAKNGGLADYDFGPEGIGSPQNFINNYARFSVRERIGRMTIQLAILLIVAALGRFMLRLRL